MDYLAEKYFRKRKTPSTACSGCGLGQVQKMLVKAIDELGMGLKDIIWGTSIGCAGRQTYAMWLGDGFAGTHGRAYAIASGLTIAIRADQKIVLTVGDGDAFGIGLLHLLNAARRNVDMTVVVCDNLGYQSTGGQYGWNTPKGSVTDSSPFGMYESNWIQDGRDVLNIIREAGATFLARHVSMDGEFGVQSMRHALQNKGFSLVHVVYPCTTNFASTALGSRNAVNVFRWVRHRACPLDQEPGPDVIWRTGIYHDQSNSRLDFATTMRNQLKDIQRRIAA